MRHADPGRIPASASVGLGKTILTSLFGPSRKTSSSLARTRQSPLWDATLAAAASRIDVSGSLTALAPDCCSGVVLRSIASADPTDGRPRGVRCRVRACRQLWFAPPTEGTG